MRTNIKLTSVFTVVDLVIWLIISTIGLYGCSGHQNKEPSESSRQSTMPDTQVVADLCVMPLVGIGTIKFEMTREDVIRKMGEPDCIQEHAKGQSLMYLSKGFSVTIDSRLGMWSINCFTHGSAPPHLRAQVDDFKGITQEGIAMGASETQIIAAYGEPDTKKTQGLQTTLSYDRLQLHFILFSDRLVQLGLMLPLSEKH